MKFKTTIFIFLLTSCGSTVNNNPIEIYKMSKVYFGCADHFVIYNHEGKSDSSLTISIVDFNRKTMTVDSLLHNEYYIRRFYKRDRDLTKDYDDEGDPDAIRDYADRSFVDIMWTMYQNEFSDTLVYVDYYIYDKKIHAKIFMEIRGKSGFIAFKSDSTKVK